MGSQTNNDFLQNSSFYRFVLIFTYRCVVCLHKLLHLFFVRNCTSSIRVCLVSKNALFLPETFPKGVVYCGKIVIVNFFKHILSEDIYKQHGEDAASKPLFK